MHSRYLPAMIHDLNAIEEDTVELPRIKPKGPKRHAMTYSCGCVLLITDKELMTNTTRTVMCSMHPKEHLCKIETTTEYSLVNEKKKA
jgi:hypothetical protein